MDEIAGESTSSTQTEATTAPARQAAFFDLDGTLVDGQTTLLLVMFLRRQGMVSLGFMVGTALWFLGYKLGLVRVNERTRHQGARVFAGRTAAEVQQAMGRFTDEVLAPRFDAAATEALTRHQARGDYVVVISAALEPVVRAVCRRLAVTEFTGTECELEGDLYCGRLVGASPHGLEKEGIAAGYMERWGVDAADCWAYADHESDLALLRSVGHPVAVNPKPGLLTAAKVAGWPILR